MFHILIVEDNPSISKLFSAILKHDGYNTYNASNGLDALEVMDKQQIDLIVLDIMMPKMDGYEFCDTLRKCNDFTPILMVTAKQLPEEKCKGFLVGTDDYMVKPINEKEFLLRVKVLLRRAQITNEKKLHIGDVTLDYDALTVTKGKEIFTIRQKEFYLLFKLLSSPNKIFTRLQLMDEIWGMDSDTIDTTINVHITRLRKRFEGWNEFEIIAIRGIGYKAVIHNEKEE